MKISTVSLRARILTLVGGFVIMALAIMLFGLASLSDYARMMGDYSRAYENAYMGERLNHVITSILMEQRGLYLAKTPEEDQRSIKNIGRALQELEDVMSEWQAEKVATPEIHLDTLAPRIETFRQFRYDVLRVALTQSKKAGEQFGMTRRPQRLALQADIEQMVEQTRHTLSATKARAEAYRQERMVTFVLATLAWITLTTGLILWVIAHFITREITRIRSEEEKREKLLKQLMETHTELERFAYAASHDMQEPMRMINIYSELIATDYNSQLDDTGREYIGMVTGSARRMLGLVQDLVQYSGFQNGHDRHIRINLNTQLDHIRHSFAGLISDTSARIEATPLPEVTGNPIQIQRLFVHLIANAIKYQPPGQTPVITLSAANLGTEWRISVRDNGLGIAPEFAAQIFEPFRRLHTWDQYEGSGMGLAICRKIVEHHGGRIWAERVDVGACLCFTLPMATNAPLAA